MLYVTPLSGVYAAVRLLMPIAPDSILMVVGLFALASAVYAAGMATIQSEARRFFAHLFLSHASLVLIGLELHTDLSLTGSLCLWFSVILSLGGFGLTLRALEARFGRLSLNHYHGLYEHSPTLAVCFLLTGLASVGFPCTIGFISTEMLVDGAVESSAYVGIAVIAAAALNGIAVMRAYFLLFTGTRHLSTVSLGIGLRERIAVLTLSLLILAGGLYPQPGVTSRERAAEAILHDRRFGQPAPPGGPWRDHQSREGSPTSSGFDMDASGHHRQESTPPFLSAGTVLSVFLLRAAIERKFPCSHFGAANCGVDSSIPGACTTRRS